MIQWTDRSWHWTAWDGAGEKTSRLEDRRDSARYAAETAMRKFEQETAHVGVAPVADRGAEAKVDGHPHSITDMLNRQSNNPGSARMDPIPGGDTSNDIGRNDDRGL